MKTQKIPHWALGCDVVDVPKMARLIHQSRFLKRVFTAEEIAYCRPKKNAAQHFAVRFAAKEAVWKALSESCGLRGIAHQEISVARAESGRPLARLSRRLKKYEPHLKLTLSHTDQTAMAVALLWMPC